jgi:hypothetical protein
MMKKHMIMVVAALAAALVGCASVGAENTEAMLAAAQFTMKKADTPARLAKLRALTQNRIMTHTQNGKNFYVYADAAQCQCVYIGDEASYQNYQQIRIAKNIADEQQATAEMNQDAMMDWNAWGPGPWVPGMY